MDEFRLISKRREYSERALCLTAEIILHNASHYTIWVYRRDIIDALRSNLEDELHYTTQLLDENPKSYQIWLFSFLKLTIKAP